MSHRTLVSFLIVIALTFLATSCDSGEVIDPIITESPTLTPQPTQTNTPTLIPTATSTPIPEYQIITKLNLSKVQELPNDNLPDLSAVWRIQWDNSSKLLAILTEPFLLQILDINGFELLNTINLIDYEYRGYSISPDFSYVAVYLDYGVMILDTYSGEEIQFIPLKSKPRDVAFSPDNRFIVLAMRYGLFLWNLEDEILGHELENEKGWTDVQFSNDGEYIYSISHEIEGEYDYSDYKFVIWNLDNFEPAKDISLSDDYYSSVFTLSNDESTLVIYDDYQSTSFSVFDIDSGAQITKYTSPDMEDLLTANLNFDGTMASVTGYYKDSLSGNYIYREQIIDVETNEILLDIDKSGGALIVLGGYNWGYIGYFGTLSFSPSGKYLISGTQTGEVILRGILLDN